MKHPSILKRRATRQTIALGATIHKMSVETANEEIVKAIHYLEELREEKNKPPIDLTQYEEEDIPGMFAIE